MGARGGRCNPPSVKRQRILSIHVLNIYSYINYYIGVVYFRPTHICVLLSPLLTVGHINWLLSGGKLRLQRRYTLSYTTQ